MGLLSKNSFLQLVHSLSPTLPFSLSLFSPPVHHYFSFAGGDGHSWPDIQAGLCLRESMQLADSEVQDVGVRRGRSLGTMRGFHVVLWI